MHMPWKKITKKGIELRERERERERESNQCYSS